MTKTVVYWLTVGAVVGILTSELVPFMFKSLVPGASCELVSDTLNISAIIIVTICFAVVMATLGVLYQIIVNNK